MVYLTAVIFLYWLIKGSDIIYGSLWGSVVLKRSDALTVFPKVSVIFAARDEEKNIPPAVLSMLGQDYPDFEVIAVNDRSSDRTPEILNAIRDPRLKVVHVTDLPKGWLGKTHALYEGYKAAKGEWLLFTDADVLMEPWTLKSALSEAFSRKLAHITLFPGLIVKSYFEAMFTGFFAVMFNTRFRPWAAKSPKSKAYVGIGAFSMLRREAYEKLGTHRALALDVADDMMLGKLVKKAGFAQMVFYGQELIRVRWVEGFKGVMTSLHKNAFRGVDYNYFFLLLMTPVLFCLNTLPFVLLFVTAGPVFFLSAVTALMIFLVYLSGQKYVPYAAAVFPAHPFSNLLFLFILWRSALSALKHGGVHWRETFYSLKELDKTPL